MTGITDYIEKILPVLSEAECLKGWTLASDKKGTYCNLRQRARNGFAGT